MPKKATALSTNKKHNTTTDKSASFETSLDQLEQIVMRLESGELPLEEALNEFERGVKLAKQGQLTLLQAEQRVQILLNDEADKPLMPHAQDPE